MPYIKMETNVKLNEEKERDFCALLSREGARAVGKPEDYVLCQVRQGQRLLFAGTDKAAAYLEVKSIGLGEDMLKALSKALCDLLEGELGIPGDRIYIEFASAQGPWWGWRGSTF